MGAAWNGRPPTVEGDSEVGGVVKPAGSFLAARLVPDKAGGVDGSAVDDGTRNIGCRKPCKNTVIPLSFTSSIDPHASWNRQDSKP